MGIDEHYQAGLTVSPAHYWRIPPACVSTHQIPLHRSAHPTLPPPDSLGILSPCSKWEHWEEQHWSSQDWQVLRLFESTWQARGPWHDLQCAQAQAILLL